VLKSYFSISKSSFFSASHLNLFIHLNLHPDTSIIILIFPFSIQPYFLFSLYVIPRYLFLYYSKYINIRNFNQNSFHLSLTSFLYLNHSVKNNKIKTNKKTNKFTHLHYYLYFILILHRSKKRQKTSLFHFHRYSFFFLLLLHFNYK
jgi:hypothetical protein